MEQGTKTNDQLLKSVREFFHFTRKINALPLEMDNFGLCLGAGIFPLWPDRGPQSGLKRAKGNISEKTSKWKSCFAGAPKIVADQQKIGSLRSI